MKSLHSFFEIVRFPLEVIFLASMMLSLGNALTNPAFGIPAVIDNAYFLKTAELLMRTGQFLIINFPLVLMIRLSARKSGSGTTMVSCMAGYVAFLMATVLFARSDLPAAAYSSIFGIAVSSSLLTDGTHYPLQTGMIATSFVVMITLLSYNRSKKKNEYGIFGFISRETSCTIRTIFFSFIAGIVVSFLWTYLIAFVQNLIHFISVDTTNPVNLTLYGILDGLFNTLGMGTMIRQSFWYSTAGGSWVDVAGASVSGDVNIWNAQLSAGSINGIAGRLITPYYVLNIFAVPGMVWAMFSLYTDPIERRRKRLLAVIATIFSLLGGTLLPLELMLLFLCPLLFCLHLGVSGILFGILQAVRCSLGYQTSQNLVVTALPGTLPEFLTYISNPDLRMTLIGILIAGVVYFIIYFFMTRAYFNYLAIDLYNTGDKDRMVKGTIKALGGIENVKMTHSSISQLVVQVYDPTAVDIERLKRLGSFRVYESKAGFRICYGAGSAMIRRGIDQVRRDTIR